jgi:hypothetical protein
MLPGVFIMSVFTFSGAVLPMTGLVKLQRTLAFINLFVKLILFTALAKFFGVWGVAVGVSMYYVFIVLNSIFIFGRYLNLRLVG